jgi:hypothetical protein
MAKYRFEDLDDALFQKLCQGVALSEMKDLQVLPTRRRDGGFDGFELGKGATKQVAVQVKWVEHQRPDRDPVKWLEGVIAGEEKNLLRMVREGTKRWILMTNTQGSPHPKTGTIDRLNAVLAREGKRLKIKMTAWWREDISGRLDRASWELKLSYPDMLVGFDALRAVISEPLHSASRQRLVDIVRTAARVEFAKDNKVRFAHGQLDGVALSQIFVDVPLAPIDRFQPALTNKSAVETILRGGKIGNLLIFGAPGQGKSTLSTYIAQLHRAHILQDTISVDPNLLKAIEDKPRLPVRIELKYYAQWLAGLDPLDPTGERRRPVGAGDSIESFAAHLIESNSGNRKFSPDDLIAIVEWLPLLFVLDGLDEVGDPKRRSEVVSQINDLAVRYKASDELVSIVVTSRPSFLAAPEPSTESYVQWELQPLNADTRDIYISKWSQAAGLEPRDVVDLRRVYAQHIDQPHVQELTTNPMQLAILLSLMYRRGDSIPANRTALYGSYMEFFLDRESANDAQVKQYRRPLESITAFLGWSLHADAESGGTGRATRMEIVRRIKLHLLDIGDDPKIAETLFTAMAQRVWVLSSRATGTFEFDVQPIREFFAARHLFQTAPAHETTTSPDRLGRFADLMKRPFWLNVTRFMGGMFTAGEASGLADLVVEAVEHPRNRAWTRLLAKTLLEDAAFDAAPRARLRVIEAAYDDIGIALLAEEQPRALAVGAVASQAIANHLRSSLVKDLHEPLAEGRATLLAGYRDLNAEQDAFRWWHDRLRSAESERDAAAWLRLMTKAGASGDHVSASLSHELFDRWPSIASDLLEAGCKIHPKSDLEKRQLQVVLDGDAWKVGGRSFAADFARITSSDFLWMKHPIWHDDDEDMTQDEADFDVSPHRRMGKRSGAGQAYSEALRSRAGSRENSLPWSQLANAIQMRHGRTWRGMTVAVDGVAESRRTLGLVAFSRDLLPWGPDAHPAAVMRDFRGRNADLAWWAGSSEFLDDDLDCALFALGLLTVAKPAVLVESLDILSSTLTGLPAVWLDRLYRALREISFANQLWRLDPDFDLQLSTASALAKGFVAVRSNVDDWRPTDKDFERLQDAPALRDVFVASEWSSRWGITEMDSATFERLAIGRNSIRLRRRDRVLTDEQANTVFNNVGDYPVEVVLTADDRQRDLEERPLSEVAMTWFEEPNG